MYQILPVGDAWEFIGGSYIYIYILDSKNACSQFALDLHLSSVLRNRMSRISYCRHSTSWRACYLVWAACDVSQKWTVSGLLGCAGFRFFPSTHLWWHSTYSHRAWGEVHIHSSAGSPALPETHFMKTLKKVQFWATVRSTEDHSCCCL